LFNEPGYYKTGEYGIRIETGGGAGAEIAGGEKRCGFETITMAPITLLVSFDADARGTRLAERLCAVRVAVAPALTETTPG
jgi:hypothetical protein